MNKAVFGKTIKNTRKHINIKLVTTEKRRNYLVSEPNYHTIKFFTEHLLSIEMNKTHIPLNKSLYLGLLILELSKILIYGSWYEYKQIKADDICKEIAEDVGTKFDTSSCEFYRELTKVKYRQGIGLKLGEKL